MSRGLHAAGDAFDGEVADDLAAGRDLDDVAEELVHLGVGARDLRPAVARPMPAACSLRFVYWPPGISCR